MRVFQKNWNRSEIVANQLGHWRRLDIYAFVDLEQRLAAVDMLEQSLALNAIN